MSLIHFYSVQTYRNNENKYCFNGIDHNSDRNITTKSYSTLYLFIKMIYISKIISFSDHNSTAMRLCANQLTINCNVLAVTITD